MVSDSFQSRFPVLEAHTLQIRLPVPSSVQALCSINSELKASIPVTKSRHNCSSSSISCLVDLSGVEPELLRTWLTALPLSERPTIGRGGSWVSWGGVCHSCPKLFHSGAIPARGKLLSSQCWQHVCRKSIPRPHEIHIVFSIHYGPNRNDAKCGWEF